MNGREHARASYALAAPTGAVVGMALGETAAGILAAGGCIAGVLLSPDLDQVGITEAEAIVYRTAGKALGDLWRIYWLPYAVLIRHRHWLSHAPLIGTLGRLGYLLAPVVVWALARECTADLWLVLWALWPLGIGLAVSDVAHWVMDLV